MFQHKGLDVALQVCIEPLMTSVWTFDLLTACCCDPVGLVATGGHHLQLQPTAECLGFSAVVQHDQRGHQGETPPQPAVEFL